MTRVPAAVAVLLLALEAVDKGRPDLVVKPATLRQWKRRGHLSDGTGYDLREIKTYVETRSTTRPLTCA